MICCCQTNKTGLLSGQEYFVVSSASVAQNGAGPSQVVQTYSAFAAPVLIDRPPGTLAERASDIIPLFKTQKGVLDEKPAFW